MSILDVVREKHKAVVPTRPEFSAFTSRSLKKKRGGWCDLDNKGKARKVAVAITRANANPLPHFNRLAEERKRDNRSGSFQSIKKTRHTFYAITMMFTDRRLCIQLGLCERERVRSSPRHRITINLAQDGLSFPDDNATVDLPTVLIPPSVERPAPRTARLNTLPLRPAICSTSARTRERKRQYPMRHVLCEGWPTTLKQCQVAVVKSSSSTGITSWGLPKPLIFVH